MGDISSSGDTMLLRALKGQPKVLNLSNKKLKSLPEIIGQFRCLNGLQLQHNQLTDLPFEIRYLVHLQVLNMGNNHLETVPVDIGKLENLDKVHMFNNGIREIPGKSLMGLKSLTLLNLNNNCLTALPREVGYLVSLKYLSVDCNQLELLPSEICTLVNLKELHAANNRLFELPHELGFLSRLEKLIVYKNQIGSLPETISRCSSLTTIDVAANQIKIFPSEFHKLSLKQLHCEVNPLVDEAPIKSLQEEEVLSLKEILARHVLNELQDKRSYLRRSIRYYPELQELLSMASKCAFCSGPFLNTWLECVHFVNVRKQMGTASTPGLMLPVRVLLCSYKCFNDPTHQYYGVAHPAVTPVY